MACAAADASRTVGSLLRWPSGEMPPRTYPVVAFRQRRVGHRRALAADRRRERLQVQLAGHRDHRDRQGAVDVRHQRLEDAVRAAPIASAASSP
ncbi:hypothetical protein SCYAM73S_03927 [Streptomyces cyaneofuscatus]